MEYISKQIAVQELENLRQQYEMHDDCDELVARKCKNAVSALPAADVVPVVHGKWVLKRDEGGWANMVCSVCGRFCCEDDAPYCYCGAKMDGGKTNEN